MSKTSTIEVNLLGQRIVLKSSEEDPETIRQILQVVTNQITEAEARSKGVAAHQVALVALLDLAAEYVKAKKRTLDFKHQVDEKSSKLLSLLEAEIK